MCVCVHAYMYEYVWMYICMCVWILFLCSDMCLWCLDVWLYVYVCVRGRRASLSCKLYSLYLGDQIKRVQFCADLVSHIWTGCVAHMNGSRHTYEWVTSHTRMRADLRASANLAQVVWVMPYNESRHTYECVRAQVWMSHVIHMNMNESGSIYARSFKGECQLFY